MKKFTLICLLLFLAVVVFAIPLFNMPYEHIEKTGLSENQVGIIIYYGNGTFIENRALGKFPGIWVLNGSIMTIDYNGGIPDIIGTVTGNNNVFLVGSANKFVRIF